MICCSRCACGVGRRCQRGLGRRSAAAIRCLCSRRFRCCCCFVWFWIGSGQCERARAGSGDQAFCVPAWQVSCRFLVVAGVPCGAPFCACLRSLLRWLRNNAFCVCMQLQRAARNAASHHVCLFCCWRRHARKQVRSGCLVAGGSCGPCVVQLSSEVAFRLCLAPAICRQSSRNRLSHPAIARSAFIVVSRAVRPRDRSRARPVPRRRRCRWIRGSRDEVLAIWTSVKHFLL